MIGHLPALDVLNLVDGQDLTHKFSTVGDPLPGGSVVSLQLDSSDHSSTFGVWPVTASGADWVVNVVAADHAAIPHGARFRLYVTYPSGGRYCWIAGPVNRSRR